MALATQSTGLQQLRPRDPTQPPGLLRYVQKRRARHESRESSALLHISSHEDSLAKDRRELSCKAGSLLVPDITATPGESPIALQAARKAVAAMSKSEIIARVGIEITLVLIAAKLVVTAVDKLGQRASRVMQSEKQKPRQNAARIFIDAGIEAAQRPIKLLVPVVAAFLSLRTLSLGLQIFVEDEIFRNRHTWARHLLVGLFEGLSSLDRYTDDFWQLGIIGIMLWILLGWKERLVKFVVDIEKKSKDAGGEGFGLDRIALPLSSLGGWALIVVSVLSALHVVGINIQPLLAVGGVSGIAIGFGAQTVTANAIAGVNLFLTRPFVVGDRIVLKTTGGGTVLVGIVEHIDPMRTVLRTDDTVPVAVPNKAITDYIVANESRLGRSDVVTEFRDPRQYLTSFKVKNTDFDKLEGILGDILNYLKTSEGVDKTLPMSAKLQALGDSSVTVGIMAHTTATQSREFQNFNHEVLMTIADIMVQRGAKFA